MRKIFAIIFALLFSVSFAWADEMQVTPVLGPQTFQQLGTGDAWLNPTRYPNFYDYSSDNPACGEYLKASFDPNAVSGGVSQAGFTLAPLWIKSKYGTGVSSLSAQPPYSAIPGLSFSYNVPEAYRKTANLLITWTVRMEGYSNKAGNSDPHRTASGAYIVWPNLCSGWHGTSNQKFDGGDATTALYINGKQIGAKSVITIPDSGFVTTVTNIMDPTNTGSCLVQAADYGGEFPETLSVEIRWYNDTCLFLKSPDKMRSVVVTVLPIERTITAYTH